MLIWITSLTLFIFLPWYSTYARWAAYLGDARRVQLYALDNSGSQEFIQTTMKYPWKHSQIQERVQWPVFPSRN